MPPFDCLFQKTGRTRKRDGRLGEVVAWVGFDQIGKFAAFCLRAVRTNQHAIATRFAHSFNHQLVQIFQHIAAVSLAFAEIGVDVGQNRLFFEIVADHLWHIGIDRFVVGDTGADGVCQRDIAAAIGVEEPRHAEHRIFAKYQRVDKIVVDAAVDHIHPLQTGSAAHVDLVVVGQQVAPFHQLNAHLAGEKGVFKIGRVVDTRRKQHNVWLAASNRCQRLHCVEQRLPVEIERTHGIAVEERGKGALHHLAVDQHVGCAAGHAQIVFEHGKAPVWLADEVGADDCHVNAVWHIDIAHLAAEVLAAVDQLKGHHLVAENLRLMVNIIEKEIERGDTLREPTFNNIPFGGCDDAWQQVKGKDALRALGVAVDSEGDALKEKRFVGRTLTLLQLLRRQFEQCLIEQLILWTRVALAIKHFVKGSVKLIIDKGRVVQRRRKRV